MKSQSKVYLDVLQNKNVEFVNQFLVSVFLESVGIGKVSNSLVNSYRIKRNDRAYELVVKFKNDAPIQNLDELIQVFEYVISPAEKIVTGAVYTPEYIRSYIISKTFDKLKNLKEAIVCDPACGCASFLVSAAIAINHSTGKSYQEIIEENIHGLDIAPYSIERSKIILSLLAILKGEDVEVKMDNLKVGNALNFDWFQVSPKILANGGFDCVVGNPPYVCYRNIDLESKSLLSKWKVVKSGHPDLYIPFFQIGIESLKKEGVLGYITVNTFFKSVNGRALRDYLSRAGYQIQIIDFKDEQLFKKRNTYTCLFYISKKSSGFLEYTYCRSSDLQKLTAKSFKRFPYDSLDDANGWNLLIGLNKEKVIEKIENAGDKIFDLFGFSTGIATLKNDVYIFSPVRSDGDRFSFIDQDRKEYEIEKAICRKVINANRIKSEEDVDSSDTQIIFPYQWDKEASRYVAFEPNHFKRNFPCAWAYLKTRMNVLKKRDNGKEVVPWFAFGRSQGMRNFGMKLFLPHIAKKPSFIISSDSQLLFYNGEAILSSNDRDLKVLKYILESRVFLYYIKTTSKPYSSGYFSLAKLYLKGFTIPKMTIEEKIDFLNMNEGLRESFLLDKYNLKVNDIT